MPQIVDNPNFLFLSLSAAMYLVYECSLLKFQKDFPRPGKEWQNFSTNLPHQLDFREALSYQYINLPVFDPLTRGILFHYSPPHQSLPFPVQGFLPLPWHLSPRSTSGQSHCCLLLNPLLVLVSVSKLQPL